MNMTSRYKKIKPISSHEMAERILDGKAGAEPLNNELFHAKSYVLIDETTIQCPSQSYLTYPDIEIKLVNALFGSLWSNNPSRDAVDGKINIYTPNICQLSNNLKVGGMIELEVTIRNVPVTSNNPNGATL
jgi:hypothetical protein